MKKLKKHIWKFVYWFLGIVNPKLLVSVHFKRTYGRPLNWKCPRDIDEKINWLKFYGDTSEWPRLADKYRVREYVEECGFSDMLVPLYGKWDKAEDIDWDSLPSEFVMKTNHGSGDALICRDKSKLDIPYWTAEFSRLLKQKFGRNFGEPHYDKIPPCIVAEKLLDNTHQLMKSSSLVDYKIWTFNGKPTYIWVCYNRDKHRTDVLIYDTEWNAHPEFSVSLPHYVLSTQPIPRPQSLDAMLNAASVLSKGFPEVRIDFYEVDGKPYFGEMTFSAAAGFNNFYSREFLNILGDITVL